MVYETLGDTAHSDDYNEIIKAGTVHGSKKIFSLIKEYAEELGVSDDENMELIDMMCVKGLLYDFFGADDADPKEAISEKSFDIEVDEDGKKYKIRGFIDKLFLYSKEKRAIIRDFKTSKQVYKGKEISDNLQNLMYCLAVKLLYPDYENREVEFVFVKFDLDKDLLGHPGKGILKMEKVSSDELDGFEYQLTAIQEFLENFNKKDAESHYAANQGYPSDGSFGGPLMCGKEGFKKSKGELLYDDNGDKIPNFICEFRKPMVYYSLLDNEEKILRSVFEDDKSKLTADKAKGEKIEKRFYDGCPHFHGSSLDLV
tara:strand:+ start:868 stop:1809 length:942 start_codon:yes stop_codon:yes gene_type:complete